MKIPERDTAVFSTSAIDLFASALGAFILLVMLLFPYYRNAGRDEAFSRSEAIMQLRRQADGATESLLADSDRMQSEIERLDRANEGMQQDIAVLKERLADRLTQLSEREVVIPEPDSDIEAQPEAVTDGVEFSILGLATESKSFVIVIDMSGSMINFSDLMLRSIIDILEPLDDTNQFAFVGYQGNPMPTLWRFPGDGSLMRATPENLTQAREYARSLTRKFVGSTPTHFALQSALEYPARSIILMSDGEPNTHRLASSSKTSLASTSSDRRKFTRSPLATTRTTVTWCCSCKPWPGSTAATLWAYPDEIAPAPLRRLLPVRGRPVCLRHGRVSGHHHHPDAGLPERSPPRGSFGLPGIPGR